MRLFFRGSVIEQDTSEPQPSSFETQENGGKHVIGIILKAELSTIQSINQLDFRVYHFLILLLVRVINTIR